jgi:hypothetical protein
MIISGSGYARSLKLQIFPDLDPQIHLNKFLTLRSGPELYTVKKVRIATIKYVYIWFQHLPEPSWQPLLAQRDGSLGLGEKSQRLQTVSFETVRYGSVRFGTVRYGTIRYGTYGTVVPVLPCTCWYNAKLHQYLRDFRKLARDMRRILEPSSRKRTTS